MVSAPKAELDVGTLLAERGRDLTKSTGWQVFIFMGIFVVGG